MNVAIPELDGRIISVPLSFKEEQADAEVAGTPVVGALRCVTAPAA